MDVGEWPLDDVQRRAVSSSNRLVSITGAPGSGRTHALLARCWRLLEGGVPAAAMQLLVHDRRAVGEARTLLGGVGGCRVDTVTDFCVRLVRRVDGPSFTVLSYRDACWLLGLFLDGGWPGGDGEVFREPTGRQRLGLDERAARILRYGPGGEVDGWESFRDECGMRDLYDGDRVLERAAEILREDPALGAGLRSGPCRWLMVDDAHLWGGSGLRLLEGLVGEEGSVTLAGDVSQRAGDGENGLEWMDRWWDTDVAVYRLGMCHRSTGAVCDTLGKLGGRDVGGYLPWGEDVAHLTGRTPRESEALAAETVRDWLQRGVDARDVAVIDLWGDGGRQGLALQMSRVGVTVNQPRDWNGEEGDGDAADAVAMLRLLGNQKDVVALARTWWRGADGGPRQVGTRLMKNVVAESEAWDWDLLAGARSRSEREAWTEGEGVWLSDLLSCQDALVECLARGVGLADVLDWRRRKLWGNAQEGSARFGDVTRSLWSVEGRGREGLALVLDRLVRPDEVAATAAGVEVVSAEGSVGREWRGVCVLNAVRPRDDDVARRRAQELYSACGRAREYLAVFDYEVDYLRRPAVSLLGAGQLHLA